jgi:hypothetical protein
MSLNTDKLNRISGDICCRSLSDLIPPPEIIEAALRVSVWMAKNGYKNWRLGDVCDRRYAEASDSNMAQ